MISWIQELIRNIFPNFCIIIISFFLIRIYCIFSAFSITYLNETRQRVSENRNLLSAQSGRRPRDVESHTLNALNSDHSATKRVAAF